jgi:uncharacterized protein (DUF1778 family)
MMRMKTATLTVRIDHETAKAIGRAADADQRSISSLLAKIIADWLRRQPKDQP